MCKSLHSPKLNVHCLDQGRWGFVWELKSYDGFCFPIPRKSELRPSTTRSIVCSKNRKIKIKIKLKHFLA